VEVGFGELGLTLGLQELGEVEGLDITMLGLHFISPVFLNPLLLLNDRGLLYHYGSRLDSVQDKFGEL
jgi:hypothetical protein